MLVVKAETSLGKKLVKLGQNYEGKYLSQVYETFSEKKADAWNDCYDMFLEEKGELFSIVSHNSWCFSVSWFTDDGMRVITKSNSYLVVFND